jgi:hypothetical protein
MNTDQAIKEICNKISEAKKRPGFRSEHILWLERLRNFLIKEEQISDAVFASMHKTISDQQEVIIKLAAIIQLHGISYPNLSQSIGFIRDLNNQLNGTEVLTLPLSESQILIKL